MTAPGPLYPPFYPPAYPIVPVPAPVPERLLVNGEPITGWCDIEGLTNLIVAPPPRGANVTVPGRHGVIRTPRKPRAAAEIVLPLWVKGVNRSDGNIPPRSAARLHENIDYLLTIFHGETVELEYVRDDGTSRTVTAELAEEPVVAFRERSYPPLARLSVPLTLFDPFWTEDRDVATTITGVTGTAGALNAFAGSTAPITDAVITFYGPVSNPSLAIGDRWVRYNGVIAAGRQLVLECAHWRAGPGTGSTWSPDERQVYREPGPCWLEIPPSYNALTATFTHTGGGSATVEIAGRRRFLSP